ncbi:hypothetical protein C823_003379 [Eubacterium plexicaudatum ASF492]|uniref:Uncharacterized protein n=1 Tax=Eubacterium plexicaudatum ASF492 TaxID=1235802 RepID=N2AIW3_9FIRM|nr:hypothetical protein C823_003379 [Eubacterium plexicaudatum ASF492]
MEAIEILNPNIYAEEEATGPRIGIGIACGGICVGGVCGILCAS